MYRNRSIGVVVLAYNEQDHIADTILNQPSFVDRIYVVDDCSMDDTWNEILAASHADVPPARETGEETVHTVRSEVTPTGIVHSCPGYVVPIRHHKNRGPGGATKTGYHLARTDRMDIIVKIDGDGQMDPEKMTRLLDPIIEGRVDYAKGNRLRSAAVRDSMPTFRFVGNILLTILTRIASGYWNVSDPLNGYTAISHRALDSISIKDLYEQFGFHSELLVRLNVAGMDVGDVTMSPFYGTEVSSIRYTTFIPTASMLLLRTFLWRLRIQYFSQRGVIEPSIVIGSITSALGAIGVIESVRSRANGELCAPVWTAWSVPLIVLGFFLLLVRGVRRKDGNEARAVIIDE